ncbi:MAG TPA: helix-turn-helix domain-containing protein [Solirubrobacteraceae bacterium]|nr:helix-turn-helix domain-containing protein [Solirubrobacteraceae bacterium]
MLDRGWTQRDLAMAVGVDPAHVCRLLKRGTHLRVTPELVARVAGVLEVEPDYFVEYREWRVLEAVRRSPSLRERLFARIAAASDHASTPRSKSRATIVSGTADPVAERTGALE